MSLRPRLRRQADLPRPRDDNDVDELLAEGERAEERPCPTCEATGRCPTCNGRGKVLPADAQGALLRARRLRAGVRLRELAQHMNVSPTYIGDLELGQRRITAPMLKRYLDALRECGGE